MADDVVLNPGTGGDTIAADEISSKKYQYVKLIFGAAGVNDGDVDASNPFPVTLAAGTKDAGVVVAELSTKQLRDGTTATPYKFAKIDITASADLVAVVASKKIRVLALFCSVTTSGQIRFQSDAATDLTGDIDIITLEQLVLPFNPAGWFETASGKKLNLVITTVTKVDGALTYVEI